MRTLGALVAAGVALAGVPLLELPAFYESFFYLVFFWTVLATSWNILSGYSGYFSFGHGAFFGTGMYTTATLTTKAGMPFLWTLPVCAAMAALSGIAIGAVVFRAGRLRGELFALLTLAVSYVLATVILNTPIDGGPGVSLAAVAVPHQAATPPSTFYLLAFTASDYAVAGRAAVGLILIVVILFMPQGVLGHLLRWSARPQAKAASALESTHRRTPIQDLTPLLSATGVSKAFAGVHALAGV